MLTQDKGGSAGYSFCSRLPAIFVRALSSRFPLHRLPPPATEFPLYPRQTRPAVRWSGSMGVFMRLTEEQEQAVAQARKMGSFKVSALAGTGKTTTLVAIAESLKGKRGLYLSFNKAIAQEAQKKFQGTGCDARTFHSLAFSRFGKKYGSRLGSRLSPGYLRDRLAITGEQEVAVSEVALNTLGRFLRSTDMRMEEKHVGWNDACKNAFQVFRALKEEQETAEPGSPRWSEINQKLAEIEATGLRPCRAIRDRALREAQRALEEMQRRGSDMPITHDLYLREFVFSRPDLSGKGFGYDYLLFDEAQDADHLMLRLTQDQKIPVFYVGDAYQQIYEWRGASNAMQHLDLPETRLTMSFRFGQRVADDANLVLDLLGAQHFLRGHPDLDSRVWEGDPGSCRAVIVRTNEEVMNIVAGSMAEGLSVGVSGRDGVLSFLRDFIKLSRGEPSGQFALFRDLDELWKYAETEEGQDLKILLRLASQYSPQGLESMLVRTVDLDRDKAAWASCDQVVVTAHKAKGLEFDSVALSEGLFNPRRLEQEEELRLLYVAKTRAKKVLVNPEGGNAILSICRDARPARGPGFISTSGDDLADCPGLAANGAALILSFDAAKKAKKTKAGESGKTKAARSRRARRDV